MRKSFRPSQVCNLDENEFTSGRDLNYTNQPRVFSATKSRTVFLRAQFRYISRISILVAVFSDGVSIHPAVVFPGDREPLLSKGSTSEKISKVVPQGLYAF